MTLQRGALQKGEKFKESEVRPKVEAQLEKDMVLNWLEERAKITTVEGEVEVNVDEVLGARCGLPFWCGLHQAHDITGYIWRSYM